MTVPFLISSAKAKSLRENNSMKIIFAGTPEVAVPTLEALHEAGHDIVSVLTREDAPIGRKRVLTPSPVARAANELGLPVVKANRITESVTELLTNTAAEVGVIVAYGGLLKAPLLSAPKYGWLNLHFSTLPAWRGAAPVQRALMAGETKLGMTVFRLVEALDAGPILSQGSHTVPFGTPAGEALKKLSHSGTELVLSAISKVADEPGEEQHGEVTYAHKLTREDGRLNASESVQGLMSIFAGVTPEPGAFFDTDAGTVKVHHMREAFAHESVEVAPGTAVLHNNRVLVQAGDGLIELVTVQPAGKPAMDAAAWLRGRGGKVAL